MDNFELIASNVTSYYMLINAHFPYVFSEEDAIYLSLAADATSYLQKGLITPDDIKECITLSSICECGIFPVILRHGNFCTDKNLLLGAVMQLECLIFRCDIKMPLRDIISAVVSKKDSIENAIQHTKHNPPTRAAMANLFVNLIMLLQHPDPSMLEGLSGEGKSARDRIIATLAGDNEGHFAPDSTDIIESSNSSLKINPPNDNGKAADEANISLKNWQKALLTIGCLLATPALLMSAKMGGVMIGALPTLLAYVIMCYLINLIWKKRENKGGPENISVADKEGVNGVESPASTSSKNTCWKCGSEFDGEKCPLCGEKALQKRSTAAR